MSFRAAAAWSLIYVAAALAFGAALGLLAGWSLGTQFLAGYVVEKSLSVDNLFVFVIIMSTFAVPAEHQPRALAIGIALALVLRAIFIAAGATLLAAFSFMFLIFGVGADRDGRAAVPPPRPGSVGRATTRRRARAPPAAAVGRVRRWTDHDPGERAAVADPAVHGAARDRHDRLPVRARLDPRGLRGHPPPVHRARRERVRAARTALAVLPRLGAARSARVPLDGPVGDPRLHRRQARAAFRAPAQPLGPRAIDGGVAGGDRVRARGHDGREPGAGPPRAPPPRARGIAARDPRRPAGRRYTLDPMVRAGLALDPVRIVSKGPSR